LVPESGNRTNNGEAQEAAAAKQTVVEKAAAEKASKAQAKAEAKAAKEMGADVWCQLG